jgi:glycosyltransferase involved in cell wall biosynthesis
MNGVTVIVPCYNEAERLDDAAFLRLVDETPSMRLLFVNDGSRDATEERLRALAARRPARIEAMSLAQNSGKAEAVRHGLRAALEAGAGIVGYYDADLSTPVEELRRLMEVISARGAAVVMGARVGLLGHEIHRTASRHYLGRVFASAASLVLRLPVYDTQCGAKLLRASPTLRAALEQPFRSRWAFDVELIGRLVTGVGGTAPLAAADFLEVPLEAWRDVPGSKLKSSAMVGALRDLAQIGLVVASDRRALSRRQ